MLSLIFYYMSDRRCLRRMHVPPGKVRFRAVFTPDKKYKVYTYQRDLYVCFNTITCACNTYYMKGHVTCYAYTLRLFCWEYDNVSVLHGRFKKSLTVRVSSVYTYCMMQASEHVRCIHERHLRNISS